MPGFVPGIHVFTSFTAAKTWMAGTSPAMTDDSGRLLIILLLMQPVVQWSHPVHAADPVEQGREVYGEFCTNCHGRDLVSPGSVSFDLRQFPKDDFERFRNSVLNGKGPAMPGWRDKISDEDVADLWAYVRSGG